MPRPLLFVRVLFLVVTLVLQSSSAVIVTAASLPQNIAGSATVDVVEPTPTLIPSVPEPSSTVPPSTPETPTVTATPTILPPAVDVTSTVTVTPTGQVPPSLFQPDLPQPGAVVSPMLRLTLTADPQWAEPGAVVTFTVQLTNLTSADVNQLVLRVQLGPGLQLAANDAAEFKGEPGEAAPIWRIDNIPPQQVVAGHFAVRTDDLAIGDAVTVTVVAEGSTARELLAASTVLDIAPPADGLVHPTGAGGAILSAPEGQLLLRMPSAVRRAAPHLVYHPVSPSDVSLTDPKLIFRLEEPDSTNSEQPRLPVRVSVRRGVMQAGELPALYAYSEIMQEWQRITTYEGQDVLDAELALGTVYALAASGAGVVSEPMSKIRGATTSLFNRSITFTYPFETPRGTAGFTPAVGLMYSGANHMNQQGHYSYAGHGWEILGADYVYRQPRYDDPDYGEITLHLGGRIYTLKQTNPGGQFFAEEDPLLKIEYQKDIQPYGGTKLVKFRVRTPDGTEYHFGGKWGDSNDISAKVYFWDCSDRSEPNWYPYAWSRVPLTHIFDRSGNRIYLVWAAERSEERGEAAADEDVHPACHPYTEPGHVRAIRLTNVYYAEDLQDRSHTQVAFNYTNDRADRPTGYTSGSIGWSFYTIYRLRSVQVKVMLPNQNTWTPLRTYELEHEPRTTHYRDQKVLNLVALRDTAGALSETTSFAYNAYYLQSPGDFGSMTEAWNQYGGAVEFKFEGLGDGAGRWAKVTQRTERDGATGLAGTWTYGSTGWNGDNNGYDKVWVTAPGGGSCEIHEFRQDKPFVGREHKNTTCNACDSGGGCNGEQARHETTWESTSNALPLGNYSSGTQPQLVFVRETRDYQIGIPIKKTWYDYQPERQLIDPGVGLQFGNVTQVKEFGTGSVSSFAASATRVTDIWYYPNMGWTLAFYVE